MDLKIQLSRRFLPLSKIYIVGTKDIMAPIRLKEVLEWHQLSSRFVVVAAGVCLGSQAAELGLQGAELGLQGAELGLQGVDLGS